MAQDKAKKNKKDYVSDQTLKNLKERFDFGHGVEIALGERSSEEAPIKMTYFFSNKLPELKIIGLNNKRTLEVEVSSIQNEDTRLLHYLHSKTITLL